MPVDKISIRNHLYSGLGVSVSFNEEFSPSSDIWDVSEDIGFTRFSESQSPPDSIGDTLTITDSGFAANVLQSKYGERAFPILYGVIPGVTPKRKTPVTPQIGIIIEDMTDYSASRLWNLGMSMNVFSTVGVPEKIEANEIFDDIIEFFDKTDILLYPATRGFMMTPLTYVCAALWRGLVVVASKTPSLYELSFFPGVFYPDDNDKKSWLEAINSVGQYNFPTLSEMNIRKARSMFNESKQRVSRIVDMYKQRKAA